MTAANYNYKRKISENNFFDLNRHILNFCYEICTLVKFNGYPNTITLFREKFNRFCSIGLSIDTDISQFGNGVSNMKGCGANLYSY